MSAGNGPHGSSAEQGARVVLFDIDGTLLTTAGAARAAFTRALSEAAGRPISPDGYSFSGRTDPQIARDILARNGVEGAALGAAIPAASRSEGRRVGTARR